MESEGQGFLLEKRDKIAYMIFNRPEKLNAFRQKDYELFEDMVNDIELHRALSGNLLIHIKVSDKNKAHYLRLQSGKFQKHYVRFLRREDKNHPDQIMMDRLVTNVETFLYQNSAWEIFA